MAARIAVLARASVLVSLTVRDLVAGSGLVFAERGEHELKEAPGAGGHTPPKARRPRRFGVGWGAVCGPNAAGEYSARARKAIDSHGGTLEKAVSDAVVGVYGRPRGRRRPFPLWQPPASRLKGSPPGLAPSALARRCFGGSDSAQAARCLSMTTPRRR
jgi:class 3 adenylate cyclase